MKLFSGRGPAVGVLAATLMVASANHAPGCACCTDEGEYRFSANAPISEYQRAQFSEMKFAPNARLYLTDAGEDAIKGLESVTQENNVSVVVEPKQWRLTFRSADGKTGTLTLPAPAA